MSEPKIAEIDIDWVRVPFVEEVAPWLSINNESWQYLELTRVRTEDDAVTGIGETMIHYTGEVTSDEHIAFCIGKTASAALAAGTRYGVGLRMALLDAKARASNVPLHALFHRPQVRRWVPMAWWTTKLPPQVLASQARLAESRGFTHHKMKARPWFDAFAQVEAVEAVVSDAYRLELDWNSMLVTADAALPVLRELETYRSIGLFESPIDRGDASGHARLRSALTTPLIEHWDPGLTAEWLRSDALDGFVFEGGDPSRLFAQADIASAFRKRGFIQLCGSGVTSAWVAHLGSLLSAASLPHVTATNAFTVDLLVESLTMRDGHAQVPQESGLGIELDESVVASLAVPRGIAFAPTRRIMDFENGNGVVRSYTTAAQMWVDASDNATFVGDTRGARLHTREDDGTAEFDRDHERVTKQSGGIRPSLKERKS